MTHACSVVFSHVSTSYIRNVTCMFCMLICLYFGLHVDVYDSSLGSNPGIAQVCKSSISIMIDSGYRGGGLLGVVDGIDEEGY